ncbi:MAG: CcoQ/FixQ family Cbb3-type cytochrome c oxidase assembly chaperone [Saprospiraceae bacterium]|nr:CcoQ/FixQ family Cbb3-type cytochrome c oxidase assembly chaperone [Saprospiraceae bacterium]
MKFSYYLEKIAGIEIYPLISLILFVVFFIGVTILAFSSSKETIQHLENLPLDKNDQI